MGTTNGIGCHERGFRTTNGNEGHEWEQGPGRGMVGTARWAVPASPSEASGRRKWVVSGESRSSDLVGTGDHEGELEPQMGGVRMELRDCGHPCSSRPFISGTACSRNEKAGFPISATSCCWNARKFRRPEPRPISGTACSRIACPCRLGTPRRTTQEDQSPRSRALWFSTRYG